MNLRRSSPGLLTPPSDAELADWVELLAGPDDDPMAWDPFAGREHAGAHPYGGAL